MSKTPLIYRRSEPDSRGRGALITLHGLGGDIDQLTALQRRLDLPLERIEVQAWRARNPRHPEPVEHLGYLWFFEHQPGRPEAATFGDAIWALEQFVYGLRADGAAVRPLFLLGLDQGAALALTMAAVAPDLLSGIVAIGGCVPKIAGWTPPAEDLCGLPVLLVHDPADPLVSRERAQEDARALERRGASVTLSSALGASTDPLVAAELLRLWFAARLQLAAT